MAKSVTSANKLAVGLAGVMDGGVTTVRLTSGLLVTDNPPESVTTTAKRRLVGWTLVSTNHYSCQVLGTCIDTSNGRIVTIELKEAQAADLQAAVDAGGYTTTGAIVQEAISDCQVGHTLNDEDVQRLRTLWDEGRADGATQPFDVERILASAHARRTRSVASDAHCRHSSG